MDESARSARPQRWSLLMTRNRLVAFALTASLVIVVLVVALGRHEKRTDAQQVARSLRGYVQAEAVEVQSATCREPREHHFVCAIRHGGRTRRCSGQVPEANGFSEQAALLRCEPRLL